MFWRLGGKPSSSSLLQSASAVGPLKPLAHISKSKTDARSPWANPATSMDKAHEPPKATKRPARCACTKTFEPVRPFWLADEQRNIHPPYPDHAVERTVFEDQESRSPHQSTPANSVHKPRVEDCISSRLHQNSRHACQAAFTLNCKRLANVSSSSCCKASSKATAMLPMPACRDFSKAISPATPIQAMPAMVARQ